MPRAPKLRIPPWLPNSVADCAREEYAHPKLNTEIYVPVSHWRFEEDGWRTYKLSPDWAFYIRLTCDERMRIVWNELRARHPNGSYKWPADATIEAPSLDERQNAAMAELFRKVVHYKTRPSVAVTRGQAEHEHRDVLEKAYQLKRAVEWLVARSARFGNRYLHLLCLNAVNAAVKLIEECAKEKVEYELTLASEQNTRSARGHERWFVLNVAKEFKALFSNHMFGLTRTIASVATGREIKKSTVRSWVSPRKRKASKPHRLIPAAGMRKKPRKGR